MAWDSTPEIRSESAMKTFFYLVALGGIGLGILYLYGGLMGADVFRFLGVGAYIWIGIVHLGVSVLWLLSLYFRPDWFGLPAQ